MPQREERERRRSSVSLASVRLTRSRESSRAARKEAREVSLLRRKIQKRKLEKESVAEKKRNASRAKTRDEACKKEGNLIVSGKGESESDTTGDSTAQAKRSCCGGSSKRRRKEKSQDVSSSKPENEVTAIDAVAGALDDSEKERTPKAEKTVEEEGISDENTLEESSVKTEHCKTPRNDGTGGRKQVSLQTNEGPEQPPKVEGSRSRPVRLAVIQQEAIRLALKELEEDEVHPRRTATSTRSRQTKEARRRYGSRVEARGRKRGPKLSTASMSTRNLSTRPTLVKQDDCSDQHHGLKAQPGTDSRGSNGLSPTKTERKSPKPRSERVTNSMQIDPRFSKAYSQYIRPLVPITERQHPAQRLVPPMLQSDLQKLHGTLIREMRSYVSEAYFNPYIRIPSKEEENVLRKRSSLRLKNSTKTMHRETTAASLLQPHQQSDDKREEILPPFGARGEALKDNTGQDDLMEEVQIIDGFEVKMCSSAPIDRYLPRGSFASLHFS